MRCRTRNVRALRCKPDGWLPSWDSLTRLLQTLIVPEWRQSGQLADVSLQGIGFTGKQSDASREERQSRAEGNSIHHGGTEDTERSWAKVKGKTQPRISRIKESGETSARLSEPRLCGSLLIDVLLEFHARSELGDFAGGDFDDASRLRIAAVAGLAVGDGERSETDEGDAIALLQREDDGVDQGIDGSGSAGFGDAGGGSNFFNQVPFVHDGSSTGG